MNFNTLIKELLKCSLPITIVIIFALIIGIITGPLLINEYKKSTQDHIEYTGIIKNKEMIEFDKYTQCYFAINTSGTVITKIVPMEDYVTTNIGEEYTYKLGTHEHDTQIDKLRLASNQKEEGLKK
jgi:hypothetical protein